MDATPGGRVLLVEDDHIDAMLFQRACRDLPVTVRWVQTVDEAIDAATVERFDVAFVDLNLPGQPGTDFLRWASTHRAELHLIAVSTSSWEPDIERAREAGSDEYVVKGLGREFQERIRDVCAQWAGALVVP